MKIKDKINQRKQEKERKIKKYEELTISDDFMFYKVMQNQELCKELLEIILDIDIAKLEYVSRQKTLKRTYDGKGIRLDVYTKDTLGTIYNLEMQALKKDDIPKRSRYYQGLIDTDYFKESKDYNELNKSIVIFICRFDLFKKGRPVYTFKNFCEEDKDIELRDEATKIFINSKWILNKDKWDESLATPRLISLLKYIEEGNATDDYTRKLDVEVSKVKKDERWRKTYMVYEKNINYAREEEREFVLAVMEWLAESGRFEDIKKATKEQKYFEVLAREFEWEKQKNNKV